MSDDKEQAPSGQRQPTEAEEAKTRAEAAKTEAEIDKLRVEQAKLEAEMRVLEETARGTAAQADVLEIEAERTRRTESKLLRSDEFFKVYRFTDEVSEKSVKNCISQFDQWTRSAPDPVTIDLLIDSPGGSIFDGFHLIDYINWLHSEGHTVNTTAFGMAASMAGVLLQAGKERAMGANALVLIHEASFSTYGQMGHVEDMVKMVELMHDQILSLFADRSKSSGCARPLTKKQFAAGWRRKDWWLPSDQCLTHGIVDKVI